MKNTKKILGIIAIVAIIGIGFTACGDGGGGGGNVPAILIGRWNGDDNTNQKLLFTADKLFVCNATAEPTYEHTNITFPQAGTIRHQIGNHLIGTAQYSVSGNTLTISSSGIVLIMNGTYIKQSE